MYTVRVESASVPLQDIEAISQKSTGFAMTDLSNTARDDISSDALLAVTYADIEAAAERLEGHAHRTPVMTSTTVDYRTKSQVFLSAKTFSVLVLLSFGARTMRWCSCLQSSANGEC